MKRFLIGLAYFLIYTTPIQIGFVLWVSWVILTTEYTVLSLSAHIFLMEHLPLLRAWVYTYFWFLEPWLNFWWAYPAAVVTTLKLILNTWLGFWLLSVARKVA